MDNSKNSNIDIGELMKKAAQSDKGGDMKPTDINKFIEENLSASQASQIKALLQDEEKTKAILNSSAAKAIFEKLFGGGGNG